MRAPISVLLVEDHPVVLRGLRAICEDQDDVAVIGEASTAESALNQAASLRPNVVVLPVRLGGTRAGIELCRSIKDVCSARVIVFTSFTRGADVLVAMLAGADALVSKVTDADGFVATLREVASGRGSLVVAPPEDSAVQLMSPVEPLTEREDGVLRLVVEGFTNPEIAARLHIEVSTVKTHVRNILRKLDVISRRDLFEPG